MGIMVFSDDYGRSMYSHILMKAALVSSGNLWIYQVSKTAIHSLQRKCISIHSEFKNNICKGFVLLGNIMVLFYAPSLCVLGIFLLWSLEWVSNRMQFSLV